MPAATSVRPGTGHDAAVGDHVVDQMVDLKLLVRVPLEPEVLDQLARSLPLARLALAHAVAPVAIVAILKVKVVGAHAKLGEEERLNEDDVRLAVEEGGLLDVAAEHQLEVFELVGQVLVVHRLQLGVREIGRASCRERV